MAETVVEGGVCQSLCCLVSPLVLVSLRFHTKLWISVPSTLISFIWARWFIYTLFYSYILFLFLISIFIFYLKRNQIYTVKFIWKIILGWKIHRGWNSRQNWYLIFWFFLLKIIFLKDKILKRYNWSDLALFTNISAVF